VNGIEVLPSGGYDLCILERELVRQEEITGSCELCVLIDGVVKHFLTTIHVVEIGPHFSTEIKHTWIA